MVPIRNLLAGGDRRSIGRAGEVAQLIVSAPEKFRELAELLWDPHDPVLRMRAADAAEKATRMNPRLLDPYKRELLGLLAEAVQRELRWHLALMVPRLQLTARERSRAIESLRLYLNDTSSIVKTCAMQALADLVLAMPAGALRQSITDQIRILSRTGTPAMRARGKKLLAKLESNP